jgi:uncharacterized membrane protein YgcG
MHTVRRLVPLVAALVVVMCITRPAIAAGSTFTESYTPGVTVYDETGSVLSSAATTIPLILSGATAEAGPDPVFYVHRVPDRTKADAATDASYLVGEWLPTDPSVRDTLVVMVDVAGDPACPVDVGMRVGSAWTDVVSQSAAYDIVQNQLKPILSGGCDAGMVLESAAGAVAVAASAAAAASAGADASAAPAGPSAPPVGPPFPDPVNGQRVYDYAGAFTPATIAKTEATIAAIEKRIGAQVAVYTQVKPGADSSSTEADALALMDQWGVGRKGIDDGLVILWNFDESRKHGQVQLYAGPGFRNIVSNEQRQGIYENDMVPLLRSGDIDGAMLAGIARIDELATTDNANRLQLFRQANAAIGLIGGPLIFLLTAGWAVLQWRRRGRDPQVTRSQSMYMAAPPTGMTAAAGSVVLDGSASRGSLTTALLDLASRGELSFEQEETGRFVKSTKVGIRIEDPVTTDPRIGLNRREPLGTTEQWLLEKVTSTAGSDRHIPADKILELGPKVAAFGGMLEKATVTLGWFNGAPSTVKGKWAGLGIAEIIGAVVVFVLAVNLPSSGLTLLAVGLGAGGVVTAIIASVMPARTQQGALARVWLDGYRRTLKATMEQARSMEEVVARSGLTWLETPDRAIVWGTALGLQPDIQSVLERSIEDVTRGVTTAAYLPLWYHAGPSTAGGWGSAGGGGVAPGLMAGSAIPDLGGMMSALGTIGSSPSSSGSGGGFGGGGGGGGGGGAGGGF